MDDSLIIILEHHFSQGAFLCVFVKPSFFYWHGLICLVWTLIGRNKVKCKKKYEQDQHVQYTIYNFFCCSLLLAEFNHISAIAALCGAAFVLSCLTYQVSSGVHVINSLISCWYAQFPIIVYPSESRTLNNGFKIVCSTLGKSHSTKY